MKRTAVIQLSVIFLLFCMNNSFADQKTVRESLPDVTLTTPENKAHAKYLGLDGAAGKPFKISEIDADVLIIELFSMYCPYCQNAAPKVNELYERMERMQVPDLKLKIIGIGANNTELEVDTFREGFDIAFPLFSDPDLSIYKTLAGAGTPTFIGCKKSAEGNSLIFFRKSGGFDEAGEFLDDVMRRSRE